MIRPDQRIQSVPPGDKPIVSATISVNLSTVTERTLVERPLVDRAREGDRVALGQLVRQNAPMVERMLHRLLGPRRDMEDLTQSVFFEMSRALPGFRGDSTFSTFLGGITVRIARRAMRPTAWQRRTTPMLDEPVVEHGSPDRVAHAQERLRRAQVILDDLPEAQRTAFVLWALEGHDPSVIAQMTSSTVAATRSRIYYAQKKLEESARRDPWLAEWLAGGDDEVE
jgi:RNA polymerase sigma-70 factor (ECF subfamily)